MVPSPVVDVEQPLSEETKAFLYENGTKLMRALINELANKNLQVRNLERERNALRRQQRDRRGLPDD